MQIIPQHVFKAFSSQSQMFLSVFSIYYFSQQINFKTAKHLINALVQILPERSDVFERRQPEEAAVFAVELRRAFVADFERGTGGVHLPADEQPAGFLPAELFLILERAHRVVIALNLWGSAETLMP